MQVFVKSKKITVDVPDDFTDDEIKSLNDIDFAEEVVDPEAERYGVLRSWEPNFYQSKIEPFLQEIGAVDIPLVSGREPAIDAFIGTSIKGISFGQVDFDLFDEAIEQHPAVSVFGQIAGEVGAFLVTRKVLLAAGLGRVAIGAAQKAAPFVPAAMRFIPRSIMAGGTFGTKAFVNEVIEQSKTGHIDIEKLAFNTAKDTGLGALLGSISGLKDAKTAIASAGGLGFIACKLEKGDNAECLVTAAIWSTFETIGSIGRTENFRREAMEFAARSYGNLIKTRNPKISIPLAYQTGRAWIIRDPITCCAFTFNLILGQEK